MTKEKFLKKLEKNLRALPPKERNDELKSYETREDFNLDPLEIANKIYEERGMYKEIKKPIKLLDAASTITYELQKKEKEATKDILLFFLITVFIIIVIKIPFIYVRDMISNLFNDLFKEDDAYTLWYFIIEVIYAITGITYAIKKIKQKAIEIETKKSAK